MDPFFIPKALGFCTDPPVERVQPAWWATNSVSEKSSSNLCNLCWCNCKGSANTGWASWVERLLFACWEVQQPVEQPTLLRDCGLPEMMAAASTTPPVSAVPWGKVPPVSPMSWRQRFWLLQQQHLLQLRQQENEFREQQQLQSCQVQLQRELVPTGAATAAVANNETKCRALNAASREVARSIVAGSCEQSKNSRNDNAYRATRSAGPAPKCGSRRGDCFHHTSQTAAAGTPAAHSVDKTAAGGRSVRRRPDEGLHVSGRQHVTGLPSPVSLSAGRQGAWSSSAARGSAAVVDHILVRVQASSPNAVSGGSAHPVSKVAVVKASGKPVWGELQEIPTPCIYLPCSTRGSDWSSPARSNAADTSGLSTTTTRVSSSDSTFPQSTRFVSVLSPEKHM